MRAGNILIAIGLAVYLTVSALAGESPLTSVWRALDRELSKGNMPVVVFNIDGTILDNRTRSIAIIKDFASTYKDSEISDSIVTISPEEIDYYVVETFNKCGIRNLFFLEAALRYWAENFFSNNYLLMDRPVQGSSEFVRRLYNKGAFIVYVSGRCKEKMLEGTIASLKKCGFPIGEDRTMLAMLPDNDTIVVFKKRTYENISRLGKVVAAFENEPQEVNEMKRIWGDAFVFLVKQPHFTAEPIDTSITKIESFDTE